VSHTPNYVQQVSHTLAGLLPDCDEELLGLYTLLALTRGRETTLKDVHDAWSVWRCATNPGHRSLIPFEQLTQDVKELDRPYRLAIHRAAEAVAAR
jgi:hypothetical protein